MDRPSASNGFFLRLCFRSFGCLLASVLAGVTGFAPSSASAADLRLDFERVAVDQIRLRISPESTASDLMVEESAELGARAVWRSAVPESGPGVTSNTFAARGAARFFRLRQAVDTPFRILETSPTDRESGVSVTRETLVEFTAPLAAEAILGTERFHAEAAGRRLLGRVELTSDRRTAVLFLQEPAPGNNEVRVTLLGDGLFDERGRELDADGDGQPGGTLRLAYSTFATAAVPGTAVIGRVFASDLVPAAGGGGFLDRPLAGVTITVDGAEQEIRAVTDLTGGFALTNCPAGRFFVHVDGRTAVGSEWPSGAYYPFVGKAWTAVPGSVTNLAGGTGEIFLPRIPVGTLREVDALAETVVTFPAETLAAQPALAGVRLLVPPNALLNEFGNRGGRIGIAPVPPDRLPEPLPPGLDFPLVITVQTDGPQNFDRPVPVRFPNLPDRATGQKAPPGAQLGLWGFNHDLGRWVVQGTMTVSSDGAFVDSDPGSGVRQPGWLGASPACGLGGGDPKKKEPEKDKKQPCDEKWLDSRKAALEGIAQAFKALPGEGQYGKDHLERFLNGPGDTTLEYGPDSGPAHDVAGHPNFIGYDQAFQLDLDARVRAAVHQHPENPVVPDYADANPIVPDLDFYSDTSPGITSQLAAGFGGVGHPKPQVSHVNIVKNADGSITYVADLEYRIEDTYEFDADDGKLTGPNAWARDLQQCGRGHPFETRITVRKQILKTLQPFGGAPASLPVVSSPRTLADVAPSRPRGPALGLGLGASLLLNLEDQKAILQTDGSLAVFGASGPPGGNSVFVLRDLLTEAVVERGTVGPGGQPPSGLVVLANRRYRYELYHPASGSAGYVDLSASSPGALVQMPPVVLQPDVSSDADGDGLGFVAEKIIGTDPSKADTDGDGRSDGLELTGGTDPLDGRRSVPGPVASLALGEAATALATADGLLATAHNSGVSVFDIAGGLAPRRIAEWPLVSAVAIAARGRDFVAVAGTGELVLLRLTAAGDTEALFQTRLTNFVYDANLTIAVAGDRVFVPSGNTLRTVHLDTGKLESFLVDSTLGYRVASVAAFADLLVVLDSTSLRTFDLVGGGLRAAGRYLHGRAFTPGIGARVFLGDGYAAIPHSGYDLVSVDPIDAPTALVRSRTAVVRPLGTFASLADTGGPMLAAITRSAQLGTLDVFDHRSRTNTDVLVASFTPPGRAARVAVQNGRAYVASIDPWLLAYDFVAPDEDVAPPGIQLHASFPLDPARAEAGRPAWVIAHITDDVLVRDVEFYVDGQSIGRDGSYPFEARLTPRPRQPGQTRFTLQARATDIGNHTTWTPIYSVEFVADVTPPGLQEAVPAPGSVVDRRVRSIELGFDEPLDPASVRPNLVAVTHLGDDAVAGTADDRPVPGTITIGDVASALHLVLGEPLGTGVYQVAVDAGLRDLSGNAAPSVFRWTFRVDLPVLNVTQVEPFPESRFPFSVVSLSAELDGAVDPRTLSSHTFALTSAGADDRFDTPDDLALAVGTARLVESERRIRADVGQPLGNGHYRVAIASDLRGFNPDSSVVSEPWTFVIEDQVAPEIRRFDPPVFSTAAPPLKAVTLEFTEPMLAMMIPPTRLTARTVGEDFQLDTADDVVLTPVRVTAGATEAQVRFEFDRELFPGTWTVRLSPEVTDPVGHPVKPPLQSTFFVSGRTTIAGTVLNPDGIAAGGAKLSLSLGSARTAATTTAEVDGTFRFPEFTYQVGDLARVEATLTVGARQYHAGTNLNALVHGGVTSVGTLQLRERLAPTPSALVVGDFNRDGRVDVALAGHDPDLREAGLWVSDGKGDGTFEPAGHWPLPGPVDVPPSWLAAADLDRDGRLDLVTINPSADPVFPQRPATFVTLRADVRGGFAEPVSSAILPAAFLAPVLGDATGSDGIDATYLTPLGSAFAVPGLGDGTFVEPAQALWTGLAAGESVLKLAFADVNGDRRPDRIAAVGTRSGSRLRFLVSLANPDGGYAAPVSGAAGTGSVGDPAFPLIPGDLDADGQTDLVTGEYGGILHVFRGLGGGSLAARRSFQPQPFAFGAMAQPVVADLNGDGRADVVGAGSGETVIVWLGQGDGAVLRPRAAGPVACGLTPTLFAAGDFDGDGKPDILVVSRDGEFRVLRNGTDF